MELPEQDSDPNLTQMTAPVPHQELPKNNVGPPTSILKNPSGTSKQKVSESLNNIASLQTGLQLKRSMAEDCHPPIGEGPLPVPQNGALNLLRPHQQKLTNKIRPKSFQESVNDLSQDFSDGSPVFSTPVRASFRDKNCKRPTVSSQNVQKSAKLNWPQRLKSMFLFIFSNGVVVPKFQITLIFSL